MPATIPTAHTVRRILASARPAGTDPPAEPAGHELITDLLVSLWADAIRLIESDGRPRSAPAT